MIVNTKYTPKIRPPRILKGEKNCIESMKIATKIDILTQT